MTKLIKDIVQDKDWPLEGKVFCNLFQEYIRFFADHKDIEYVEACVNYMNSIDHKLIDQLCEACIRFCNGFLEEVGEEAIDFKNIRDVLKIIKPHSLSIPIPKNPHTPVIHMELSCEWEQEHGMEWVIRDNKVLYVGMYSSEDPWYDYSVKEEWNYA
jgi:hypothetical protein